MFETTWLSCYPQQAKVVCDKGPGFVGFEWDDLLTTAGIKKSFITSRNPQSNGLIKRSHQAISQVIQVLVALHPPSNADKGNKLIDTAFATAMHASLCASNSQLNFYSPRALVFHCDMFLDIPLHDSSTSSAKIKSIGTSKKQMPNALPRIIRLVIKYIALPHEKAKLILSTPDPIRFIQFTQMVQSQFTKVQMF